MDYESKFNTEVNSSEVEKLLKSIKENALADTNNQKILEKCFSLIDLTSLNSTDGYEKGKYLAEKVNLFESAFPGFQNVAAICVYPTLIEAVKENLTVKNVKIASVAAGFPSSQTFIEVKQSECKLAIQEGADELDIVVSLGSFLEGDYYTVYSEIKQVKDICGETHLKVILETGAIKSLNDVKLLSFLAMEAGADFIKTSTGKMDPAATPDAFYVMCSAIKEFFEKTGTKVGIKPAGGIVTPQDAVLYYHIVNHVLGEDWLNPLFFRLGASKLANNLLSVITGKEVSHF